MTQTPVAAPLRASDPDSVKWDRAADVVVVGFGCAGASAALEAREQGADVLRFHGSAAQAG